MSGVARNPQTTDKNNDNKLTAKQQAFCQYYVELNNGTQAAIKAGYKESTAGFMASENLNKPKIAEEIIRLKKLVENKRIATGQEVMEFFTRMMNGEEKDQFGLEVSAGDRIRAAQELAKRTIDFENRMAGQADAKVEISLKWD